MGTTRVPEIMGIMVMTTTMGITAITAVETVVTIMDMRQGLEAAMQHVISMSDAFDEMLQAFGPAKMISENVLGLAQEDWFVLQISPTPDKDNIIFVTSDIERNRNIAIYDGKLYHADSCTAGSHTVSKEVRDILDNIQNETFIIAVYRGNKGMLSGQPVAISIGPEISYDMHPDHPHLNTGTISRATGSVVLPCSLCYTDKPADLGGKEDIKLYNAFNLISIWLFRHQIWLETRRVYGQGIWIGPQVRGMTAEAHIMHFNPQGVCYCGSGKRYIECHMANDYSIVRGVSLAEAKAFVTAREPMLFAEYSRRIAMPQKQELRRLRNHLLK